MRNKERNTQQSERSTGVRSRYFELVELKYRTYDGLLMTLPYPDLKTAGMLLPVFESYCLEGLEKGESPEQILESFFELHTGSKDFPSIVDKLFQFVRTAERQIVLFDATEDAAFAHVHDLDGPGSLKAVLDRVCSEHLETRLLSKLDNYRVRVVLTAHPTQFYPDAVLSIIDDLAAAIGTDDLSRIYDILMQMGTTRFRNPRKPTPLDEARSLLWYLEHVFYDATADLHLRLLSPVCADPLERLRYIPRLEFGFWPGGDRDGNPFVTSSLTARTGQLLRDTLFGLYLREIRSLQRKLTFSGITERITRVARKLEHTVEESIRLRGSTSHGSVIDRIPALGELLETEAELRPIESYRLTDSGEIDTDLPYTAPEELAGDLRGILQDVLEKYNGLYAEDIERLLIKITAFGFHFASMDLRQESSVHTELAGQILEFLGVSGPDNTVAVQRAYLEADDPGRMEMLHAGFSQLPADANFVETLPEGLGQDTLRSLQAAAAIQRQNGEEGLHRYIISHTHLASNLLEVLLIIHCVPTPGADADGADSRSAQAAEGADSRSAQAGPMLDIVPLFESIEDLRNAHETMERLYTDPLYSEHLKRRGNKQYVMVGFSDGTKDGGYVSANWGIYRAKQRLSEQSRRNNVSIVFFDGRGGPPARGGGNTHLYYRAMGPEVESTEIQLTIQGQTVSSNFGTRDVAQFNLEQLVSAGLENSLFEDESRELRPEDVELMDRLAELSYRAYMELRGHRDYIPYLEQMTPLSYYGKTNIGSRPDRRNKADKLSLDTLRAIPFVGAWTQMKQNVPGFYGFGSALQQLFDEGLLDRLTELYQRSLFFRTMVENALQSLSKTRFSLTSFMADDPQFGEFWRMLESEARRTLDCFEAISGHREPEDRTSRASIRIREHMVLPVVVIQQYALAKLRAGEEAGAEVGAQAETRATLKKLVLKTLAPTVNAGRNAV
ncbi:MAG: phosphoenolpyruvate carboxylase [Spirochaeta sp.]|nr:phosphoenolpyruvate carboxylase [Spirochaeta sp.]